MRAGDVMQKGVISVSPELSLADLEEFLTTEDIGGAPVCARSATRTEGTSPTSRRPT
jgi:CBS domain-containing protein